MQNIQFAKVSALKKLAAGMYGTTYRCKYRNKEYVLKVQHILDSDRHNDYSSGIWRELDLYEYIAHLPKSIQPFFTRLYGYSIYDNCTHRQVRPCEIDFADTTDRLAQKLKALDESTWGIKQLFEYKRGVTASAFLIKHAQSLAPTQLYAIILQIVHIAMLLFQGGYSHDDMHTDNLMIAATRKKYFSMNGNQVRYHGYQVSAIDYGEVLHAKFHVPYGGRRGMFLTHRKDWLLHELFGIAIHIIGNVAYAVDCCRALNKKLPWEKTLDWFTDGTKRIFINHAEFCSRVLPKYIQIFPHGASAVKAFMKYSATTKSVGEILPNGADRFWFDCIAARLVREFDLAYPAVHKKYFRWCSETRWMLPADTCLEILALASAPEFIDYFISVR